MVKSTITKKYQTTVPKEIREIMGLEESDQLDWQVRDGEIIITVSERSFMERRGTIEDGPEPVEAVHLMRRERGGAE